MVVQEGLGKLGSSSIEMAFLKNFFKMKTFLFETNFISIIYINKVILSPFLGGNLLLKRAKNPVPAKSVQSAPVHVHPRTVTL